MQIPGLGSVTRDDGDLYSEPIRLDVLWGKECRIVLEGYEDDSDKEGFHTAIQAFRSCGPEVLKAAEPHIFRYHKDIIGHWDPVDDEYIIDSPSDVWKHIELGHKPIFSRNHFGDRGIYVSLECECDWEPEHGLQIVFRNGNTVCKIGPYDGHLTNASAHGDPRLENVIYRDYQDLLKSVLDIG